MDLFLCDAAITFWHDYMGRGKSALDGCTCQLQLLALIEALIPLEGEARLYRSILYLSYLSPISFPHPPPTSTKLTLWKIRTVWC